MKYIYLFIVIGFIVASCSDSAPDRELLDDLESFIEVTIDGEKSLWVDAEENRRLVSHGVSYDGTRSSDYQIGFRQNKDEYTGPYFSQTYTGGEQLVIRFQGALQNRGNTVESYLGDQGTLQFGFIAPGNPVRIKTYFSYSDGILYNTNIKQFSDLRWQFEDRLLSGPELDQQTESNDYTFAYTYEESFNNRVRYEIYDEDSRLHYNQLHVDFADASKKFITRLRPTEDTLYAVTQGSGPFQYDWNTRSNEPFITIPQGDTTTRYSVSVTDSHGQEATANATYFWDLTNEDGRTPIFSGLGAWINNLSWKILSDNPEQQAVEIIYTDQDGRIFYSTLAPQSQDQFFEISDATPIRYRGGCIDLPCPEYYLGGLAIRFNFSSVLKSPDGLEIEISAGKGLMPVFLGREL